MPGIRYWHTLTTDDIARVAEQDPVIVLPLAAIEQHGAHLPLSTDLDIGVGLLTEAFRVLAEDYPAWVLPPQAIGASGEHARFPGTVSLDPGLLGSVIHEHGRALAACGVRRLVLSNSHGGNRSVLDAAGLRLRDELGMLVVKTNYFLFPRPADVDLHDTEWRYGLHGGAVETAMMLSLRPDLVRTEQIGDAHSLAADLDHILVRVTPDSEAAAFAWLAGDLNPSGVTGNAALASRELGARLVGYYGGRLAEVIRDTRAFPLDRLSDG